MTSDFMSRGFSKAAFLLYSVCLLFVQAQTLPQDFDYSYYADVLLDAGYYWTANSSIHPLAIDLSKSESSREYPGAAFNWMNEYLDEYAHLTEKARSKSEIRPGIAIISGLGISGQIGRSRAYDHAAAQPFFWSATQYRKNWYARLYVRTTNEAASLPHYSGLERSISRAGLNSAEIDQSTLGYRNEWLNVEYGRSREIWGPFSEDNLLLSGNSPPWERLSLQVRFKHIACRWFMGFLEAVVSPEGENINRYIVGRMIEYRNGHNLVVSVGEVSMLAGENRPVDWSFLNPIGIHLEIEQNDRENNSRENASNALLFLNADWQPVSSLRLTGSFLLDEFQVDKSNREEGDADALGYIGRLAWTPLYKPVGMTLFGYYLRIDTYSLQHSNEYANLVTRGEMIGHSIGNDADDLAVGARFVFPEPVVTEIKVGKRRTGANSILDDPYRNYRSVDKVPFPSGDFRTYRYCGMKLASRITKNLHLSFDAEADLKLVGKNSNFKVWTFSARYQLPIQF